jgi:hypothetical protein
MALITQQGYPLTQGRLATASWWEAALLITPTTSENGPNSVASLVSNSLNVITVNSQSFVPIAGLKNVKPHIGRKIKRRHCLGKYAFQPRNVVGMQLSVAQIHAGLVEFYQPQAIQNLFGLPPTFLLQQQFGLVLLHQKADPSGNISASTVYSDTWIEDDTWEGKLDEDSDQLIAHDIVFNCGYITPNDSTVSGSSAAVDPQNVLALGGTILGTAVPKVSSQTIAQLSNFQL